MKIKLLDAFFFGNELNYLEKCIKSKWISSSGNLVKIFEDKIKKIINSDYALGIINCTSALQLAIKVLKPDQNDEIIVPTITFASTINATIYNNCKPIFIDCDENLLIDTKQIINFIKKKTVFKNNFSFNKKTNKRILAIIIVHTFGNLVNIDKNFVKFCKKRNVAIIEDAAESLGSYQEVKNKKIHAGTQGDIGCLSFNGNKIVTAGGGGMIVTNNKKHYNYAKYLAFQAKNDSINFIHKEVGYNFGLSNLHAAIGISQLSYLNKIINKKNKIHQYYLKEITKIEGLKIISNPEHSFSNNWVNVLEVDEKKYGLSKDKIINNFIKSGIEVRSLWYPNHLQSYCKTFQKYNVDKAYLKFKKCLCLPSSYSLTKKNQIKIIKFLKNKFKKIRH